MADDAALDFDRHRSHLTGLAYRMLGSVAESEDIVQNAYLRWHDVDRHTVDNPKAYLSRVVTRLCLDRLKEARHRRETYVGEWLPEPVVDRASSATPPMEDMAHDLSFALRLALERLSPLERAAYLLHDIFDMSFDEVAATLGRNTAACRQLAARARRRVHDGRPRFSVTRDEGEEIAEAFLTASRSGDTAGLGHLLAEAATLHSDGGGHKRAALRPIVGADKICRFFAGLARKAEGATPLWLKRLTINGLPGWVTVERDGTLQTTAVEVVDGRIAAIYVVRNPAKLDHLLDFVPAAVRASIDNDSHRLGQRRRRES